MSIESLLVHRCAIRRPTHATAAQSKQTGSTQIATGVIARFQPAGESPVSSLMGQSVASSWLGWLPAGTNVRVNDLITWTDRTPPLEFAVTGVERMPARDPSVEHHVELGLRLKVA